MTDNYFDRTLCAEPCGVMHTRCLECGGPLDRCEFVERGEDFACRCATATVSAASSGATSSRSGDTPPAPEPTADAEPDAIVYTDDQAGVDAIEALKARAVAGDEALALLGELVALHSDHGPVGDWRDRWNAAWARARALVAPPLPELDERDLRVDTSQLGLGTPPQPVRITHLPTGLQATGDGMGSPLRNKAEAIRLLRIKVDEQGRLGQGARPTS